MAHHVDAERDPRFKRAFEQSLYMSKSDLLATEHEEGYEYIRGQGQVKTKGEKLKVKERPPREPARSQSFPITDNIEMDSKTGLRGTLSWSREADEFCVEFDADSIAISADDLKQVVYSVEPPVFLLFFNQNDKPEHCFFRQLAKYGYDLRIVFECRIRGTSVDRRPVDQVIQEIENVRKKALKHAGTKTLFSFSTILRPVLEPCLAKTEKAERATDTAMQGSLPVRVKHMEVAEQPYTNPEPRNFTVDHSNSKVESASCADKGVTDNLRNPSYGKLSVGQFVLRIRDPDKRGIDYKFDEDDIFDGPFAVAELPQLNRPKPEGCGPEARTQEIDLDTVSRLALIKLKLPVNPFRRGSGINPWVAAWRIRPAYAIPPILADAASDEEVFESAKQANAPIVQKEDQDDTKSMLVISKLEDGKYARVSYCDPQGLGDDIYEVEKLRGKMIDRVKLQDLPEDTSTASDSDPGISKFFADGGKLPVNQLLVVKYLVHWAGWPSEDDTWEVARDNIPKEVIDEFEMKNAGRIVAEVPPNSPPRKRRR